VEILERELGVAIRDMQGSDIAYDVHVRRVFLRSGLARVDNRDHMIAVAREANPDRPGEIDMPAWWVGRTWCHPKLPRCSECPIAFACPQDINAANAVRGRLTGKSN
jgi:endonuclease III